MLELIQDGNTVNSISFPVTKVGFESIIKAQILNKYSDVVEVKTTIHDPDLKIVESPKTILPGKSSDFIVSFKPSIERKTPLNSKIDFDVVIGT